MRAARARRAADPGAPGRNLPAAADGGAPGRCRPRREGALEPGDRLRIETPGGGGYGPAGA